MMTQKRLALHETMELLEIINFKNVCLTKSSTMSGLVSDSTLKDLLQQDVQTTRKQLNQLTGMIS